MLDNTGRGGEERELQHVVKSVEIQSNVNKISGKISRETSEVRSSAQPSRHALRAPFREAALLCLDLNVTLKT